ncbi:MAG: hypothetical protein PHW69_03235 [Elusimicrobiaceae bacterium]|nr:hypothetical protein [Elusimicrobiaceae bacterium]
MSEPALFKSTLENNAGRILSEIASTSGGQLTAWELKMRLHLSSSQLYIALGWLMGREAVELEPENLDYIIRPAAKRSPAPPPPVIG